MNKEYKTSEAQRKAVRKWTEEHKERKKELDRLHNIRRRERIKKEHQELMKLQNNWNKLKKYIEKDYGFYDKLIAPKYGCAMGALRRIKDKMQKLEQGSDSNGQ